MDLFLLGGVLIDFLNFNPIYKIFKHILDLVSKAFCLVKLAIIVETRKKTGGKKACLVKNASECSLFPSVYLSSNQSSTSWRAMLSFSGRGGRLSLVNQLPRSSSERCR